MAEDARIRKTKEKLSKALVELLKENEFDEISPAWICERAGVNRSTFYRNYKNTTQLKEEIERKIMDVIEWKGGEFDLVYSRNSILKQLEFLKDQRDTFWALSSESFKASIFEKLHNKLVAQALAQYELHSASCSSSVYAHNVLFYISGMVGLIVYWYINGMEEPVEEIADFIVEKLAKGYAGIQ